MGKQLPGMSSPPATNTGGFGQQAMPAMPAGGQQQMGSPMQQQLRQGMAAQQQMGGQQAPTLASTGQSLNQVGHGQQSGMGNLQSFLGQQPQVSFPMGGFGHPQELQNMLQQAQQQAMGGQQGYPGALDGIGINIAQQPQMGGQQPPMGGQPTQMPQWYSQQPQMGAQQPMDIFAQQDAARQSQQRALAQEESLRRPAQQPSMGGQDLSQMGFNTQQQMGQTDPNMLRAYQNMQAEANRGQPQTSFPTQGMNPQMLQALQQSQMSLTPTGDRYRPPSPQQQRQQQVQQNLMSRGMARGEEDGPGTPMQQAAPRPMPPSRPNTQQVRPEDARMQSMRGIQQLASRLGRFG